MCSNCRTEDECICPEGRPMVHCGCDPYYSGFCSACGHDPWTTDKSQAGAGEKTHRAPLAKH